MYREAGMAALSIWQATEAAKAKAKEEQANLIAQRQKDSINFNRQQQQYLMNRVNLGKQKSVDDFNINIAAVEARDNLEMAKAGSGLSGASINELDSEIARGVNADRVAAKRRYEQGLDTNELARREANENAILSADQYSAPNFSSMVSQSLLAGLTSVGGKYAENKLG